MLNYVECVNYMEGLSKFGSVFGLDTIKAFLNRLDNPQNSLKIIQVAGTNGKGSVCAYLTKILSVSGYKVGTFNSPSVFSYNERFSINGKEVDNDTITKYINIVKEERDKLEQEHSISLPTAFELEFAAACLMFRDLNCDIVILEVGMGGRLDATNAIDNKLLSIITTIDLDHTEYLGNTKEEIAREKFGIVKDILVTYKQEDEVMKVFKQAKILVVAKEPTLLIANSSGLTFKYGFNTYKIQMLGKHQLINASLAIAAVKVLNKLGYKISQENLYKGLFLTRWPGRCEKIEVKNKLFILDGAHNPSGAKTLHDAIKLHFNDTKKAFVFGVFKDKDVVGILENMKDLLSDMYVACAPTSRALDLPSLEKICQNYSNNVITNESISKAIINAYNSDCNVIIVFGSLSILNEAKECIRGLNGQE